MSNNKPSNKPELSRNDYKPLFQSPNQGQTNPSPNNSNTGQQSTPNTDNRTTKK